jgi:hypothetical protein
MPAETDAEVAALVARLRAGDQAALAELFNRHRERLRRMVQLRLDHRLAGRVSTSDVLQEAYRRPQACRALLREARSTLLRLAEAGCRPASGRCPSRASCPEARMGTRYRFPRARSEERRSTAKRLVPDSLTAAPSYLNKSAGLTPGFHSSFFLNRKGVGLNSPTRSTFDLSGILISNPSVQ